LLASTRTHARAKGKDPTGGMCWPDRPATFCTFGAAAPPHPCWCRCWWPGAGCREHGLSRRRSSLAPPLPSPVLRAAGKLGAAAQGHVPQGLPRALWVVGWGGTPGSPGLGASGPWWCARVHRCGLVCVRARQGCPVCHSRRVWRLLGALARHAAGYKIPCGCFGSSGPKQSGYPKQTFSGYPFHSHPHDRTFCPGSPVQVAYA
jgi:hypothetical protein